MARDPFAMKQTLVRLLRYAGTAGVAALVDFGGFLALLGAGMAPVPAAILSFLAATVVNYLLTARFVFAQAASFAGYGRFLVAAAAGFAVNVGVTVLALNLVGLSPAAAKALGIAVAFLVNFTLNATLVFVDRGRGAAGGSSGDASGDASGDRMAGLGPKGPDD